MYKFEYFISYISCKGFEYSSGWIILIFKKVLQVCIWNLFIQTFLSPIVFPLRNYFVCLRENSGVYAVMVIKILNRI